MGIVEASHPQPHRLRPNQKCHPYLLQYRKENLSYSVRICVSAGEGQSHQYNDNLCIMTHFESSICPDSLKGFLSFEQRLHRLPHQVFSSAISSSVSFLVIASTPDPAKNPFVVHDQFPHTTGPHGHRYRNARCPPLQNRLLSTYLYKRNADELGENTSFARNRVRSCNPCHRATVSGLRIQTAYAPFPLPFDELPRRFHQ